MNSRGLSSIGSGNSVHDADALKDGFDVKLYPRSVARFAVLAIVGALAVSGATNALSASECVALGQCTRACVGLGLALDPDPDLDLVLVASSAE